MDTAGTTPEDMRQFAWEHWSAFLDGELSPEDARRMEQFLRQSPEAAEFMAAQRQFSHAVRQSIAQGAAQCPDGLKDRVCAALARCEEPAPLAPVLGFPWLSVGALAAATVMLATSMFLVFARTEPEPDSSEFLRARLSPIVSHVSFEKPKAEKCMYRAAVEQYRQVFADGPELPRTFAGTQCRISDFECAEINGRKVMCALYDDPNGDRFAVLIFRCGRTADLLPGFLDAAEMDISGRHVTLWREGRYVRALISVSASKQMHRRAQGLRGAA